ncbi:uncharacterized protein A1O9_02727 [Exophiala aquamarina CBS 119918]|uniref:Major facilitator superfamily (MFS) profile domain-containing protein n=1 Tax=Exophiala aquamarina CBS 119918 TaxID=1182545 RepID=A0A072PN29_9EURO|nr:uncharacterized protein A1O9_02727 [Exophiala aquamarina CBS 119918]KEF61162.1 hypothetical protein A1O9_02727 [Exophiala aquamarina CBS 119918]
MAVAAVRFAISAGTLNIWARYLPPSCTYPAGLLPTPSSIHGQLRLSAKRLRSACATAIIIVMSQLGNIWSPYIFRSNDPPRYLMAMILVMAFSGISILGCMLMKAVLRRDNKKLIAQYEGTGQTPTLHTM